MGEQPDQIRQEIAATRAQMGDTLEALSYKTDVSARLQDAVTDRVETTYGILSDAAAQALDAAGAASSAASAAAADLTADVAQRVASGEAADRAKVIVLSNPLGALLAALAVLLATGIFIARRRNA